MHNLHSFFIYINMRKFKTKKKINKKIFIVFFILLCLSLFIILSLKKLNEGYSNFINLLFDNTNFNNKREFKLPNIASNLGILFSNYKFIKKERIVFNEKKDYIYIYNTHDKEKYSDNTSVLDTSEMLSTNLKKLGINSIVEKDRVSNYNDMGLGNYEISKKFIENIKSKENILYYVDIHRDSVNNTTIEINKKKYAKIMFVLGLENPNYKENKVIMEKMNDYLNKNYKGISKGIYEKQGSGVDGVYNQDLDKNIVLIEVGGIENTQEEVNNSTEILSLMFYHILGDRDE